MRSNMSGRTLRTSMMVLASVVSLSIASPVMAQQAAPGKTMTEAEKKDAARDAYKGAEEKFGKGDFAGALEGYKTADTMVPGAAPKYKIAICLDKLGKVKEAAAAYKAFLDAQPDPEKYKDKITESMGRKEALEKTPAKIKVTLVGPDSPAGATYMVDGAAQAGPELTVAPGRHKVSAQVPGFDMATQELDVAFADQKDLSLTLTKTAGAPVAAVTPPMGTPPANTPPATTPPTTTPPAAEPPRSKVPAYVTLGLAGAGAIVGTVFGIQALGSKSDYEATPTQELFDDTERNALLADMSFGVAITFGVTGAVLLLSNRGETKTGAAEAPKSATAKPIVLPYVGPDGAGAAATMRF